MKYLLITVCIFSLLSCEKNIDFNLKESPPVLVVDAEIENGKAPTVVLSKSLSFFSKISPEILAASFVHNADVYVSNGVLTQKLKEITLTLAPGFNAYVYTTDPANPSTAFLGEINRDYSLRIVSEGKEYLSSTKIPLNNIHLDSMWTVVAPQNPDTSKRILFIRATDPPGLGSFARYFTKKNSSLFLPGENSVSDDAVVDGTTFTFQLPQGIDRNDPPKADSNFFQRGDTISVRFTNITKPTYTFWSTWEFAFQGIGNPFSQPNKVIGNISNGALGVFAGYAAQYKTVIAR
jgi:hypothetical protein